MKITHVASGTSSPKGRTEFRAQNVAELLAYLRTLGPPVLRNGQKRHMGATYDDAMTLLERGWSDTLALSFPLELRLAHLPSDYSMTPLLHYDTTGPVVDYGMLYAGVPESFACPEEVIMEGMSTLPVEIVFNAAVSFVVENDVYVSRGQCAMALAHAAQTTGRPCRIVLACRSVQLTDEPDTDVVVVLKDWTEPMDYALLAFTMCHRAMLLHIFCRLVEVWAPKSASAGKCGTPANAVYQGMDRVRRIVINHGYTRPSMMTVEGAVREALATLADESKIAL